MAAKDTRKLEPVKNQPGIYRRHSAACTRPKRGCDCSYVVVWKAGSKQHKQMFATLDLAREHKRGIGPGLATRQPLTSDTVADYYAGWIDNYRGRTARGVQASTTREYRISFEHHVLKLPIARMRLRDLTPSVVKGWFAELERRGASPATIKRARIALRVMLADAVENDEITSNAAADARYIPTEAVQVRHAKPEPRRLGEKDVVAILQAMSGQWQVFFYMLAQTGVRVGELLGLRWKNVHLGDDPYIMVAEQVYRGKRKKLKTEKSKGEVPLSPFMASSLGRLRPTDFDPDAPVFPTKTGGTLNYTNVYNRVLRPALVDAGIAVKVGEDEKKRPVWDYQRVGFHAFRHACLTLIQNKLGKHPAQARAWARHAQVTTTMRYTHQDDDGMGSADGFDELLGAGTKWGNARGNLGATGHPETATDGTPVKVNETAS